jgi:hypothetical protein
VDSNELLCWGYSTAHSLRSLWSLRNQIVFWSYKFDHDALNSLIKIGSLGWFSCTGWDPLHFYDGRNSGYNFNIGIVILWVVCEFYKSCLLSWVGVLPFNLRVRLKKQLLYQMIELLIRFTSKTIMNDLFACIMYYLPFSSPTSIASI